MNSTSKENESPLVGILMGSPSDAEIMSRASNTLNQLGVPCEVLVRSAHRTPDESIEYARSARERGLKVIIAGAGLAAHLAGVVAAYTPLPVIGVPIGAGPLAGQDALLSTVQMPPGTPVATVAINGAQNAAYLAARILALADAELAARLEQAREERRRKVIEGD
jgi:phosphoribosylaminoimidazole carboxylase PurE protein